MTIEDIGNLQKLLGWACAHQDAIQALNRVGNLLATQGQQVQSVCLEISTGGKLERLQMYSAQTPEALAELVNGLRTVVGMTQTTAAEELAAVTVKIGME